MENLRALLVLITQSMKGIEKFVKQGRRSTVLGRTNSIISLHEKIKTKDLTEEQKSRLFLEEFRKEGFVIDTIIKNSKDNELFRTAWWDFIDETSGEFEMNRNRTLSRRAQKVKLTQVPNQQTIQHQVSKSSISSVKQASSRLVSLEEREKNAFENPVYDEKIKQIQKQSIKNISQQIEDMMLEFSKNRDDAIPPSLCSKRGKNNLSIPRKLKKKVVTQGLVKFDL